MTPSGIEPATFRLVAQCLNPEICTPHLSFHRGVPARRQHCHALKVTADEYESEMQPGIDVW
jgi:hypothetical protein